MQVASLTKIRRVGSTLRFLDDSDKTTASTGSKPLGRYLVKHEQRLGLMANSELHSIAGTEMIHESKMGVVKIQHISSNNSEAEHVVRPPRLAAVNQKIKATRNAMSHKAKALAIAAVRSISPSRERRDASVSEREHRSKPVDIIINDGVREDVVTVDEKPVDADEAKFIPEPTHADDDTAHVLACSVVGCTVMGLESRSTSELATPDVRDDASSEDFVEIKSSSSVADGGQSTCAVAEASTPTQRKPLFKKSTRALAKRPVALPWRRKAAKKEATALTQVSDNAEPVGASSGAPFDPDIEIAYNDSNDVLHYVSTAMSFHEEPLRTSQATKEDVKGDVSSLGSHDRVVLALHDDDSNDARPSQSDDQMSSFQDAPSEETELKGCDSEDVQSASSSVRQRKKKSKTRLLAWYAGNKAKKYVPPPEPTSVMTNTPYAERFNALSAEKPKDEGMQENQKNDKSSSDVPPDRELPASVCIKQKTYETYTRPEIESSEITIQQDNAAAAKIVTSSSDTSLEPPSSTLAAMAVMSGLAATSNAMPKSRSDSKVLAKPNAMRKTISTPADHSVSTMPVSNVTKQSGLQQSMAGSDLLHVTADESTHLPLESEMIAPEIMATTQSQCLSTSSAQTNVASLDDPSTLTGLIQSVSSMEALKRPSSVLRKGRFNFKVKPQLIREPAKLPHDEAMSAEVELGERGVVVHHVATDMMEQEETVGRQDSLDDLSSVGGTVQLARETSIESEWHLQAAPSYDADNSNQEESPRSGKTKGEGDDESDDSEAHRANWTHVAQVQLLTEVSTEHKAAVHLRQPDNNLLIEGDKVSSKECPYTSEENEATDSIGKEPNFSTEIVQRSGSCLVQHLSSKMSENEDAVVTMDNTSLAPDENAGKARGSDVGKKRDELERAHQENVNNVHLKENPSDEDLYERGVAKAVDGMSESYCCGAPSPTFIDGENDMKVHPVSEDAHSEAQLFLGSSSPATNDISPSSDVALSDSKVSLFGEILPHNLCSEDVPSIDSTNSPSAEGFEVRDAKAEQTSYLDTRTVPNTDAAVKQDIPLQNRPSLLARLLLRKRKPINEIQSPRVSPSQQAIETTEDDFACDNGVIVLKEMKQDEEWSLITDDSSLKRWREIASRQFDTSSLNELTPANGFVVDEASLDSMNELRQDVGCAAQWCGFNLASIVDALTLRDEEREFFEPISIQAPEVKLRKFDDEQHRGDDDPLLYSEYSPDDMLVLPFNDSQSVRDEKHCRAKPTFQLSDTQRSKRIHLPHLKIAPRWLRRKQNAREKLSRNNETGPVYASSSCESGTDHWPDDSLLMSARIIGKAERPNIRSHKQAEEELQKMFASGSLQKEINSHGDSILMGLTPACLQRKFEESLSKTSAQKDTEDPYAIRIMVRDSHKGSGVESQENPDVLERAPSLTENFEDLANGADTCIVVANGRSIEGTRARSYGSASVPTDGSYTDTEAGFTDGEYPNAAQDETSLLEFPRHTLRSEDEDDADEPQADASTATESFPGEMDDEASGVSRVSSRGFEEPYKTGKNETSNRSRFGKSKWTYSHSSVNDGDEGVGFLDQLAYTIKEEQSDENYSQSSDDPEHTDDERDDETMENDGSLLVKTMSSSSYEAGPSYSCAHPFKSCTKKGSSVVSARLPLYHFHTNSVESFDTDTAHWQVFEAHEDLKWGAQTFRESLSEAVVDARSDTQQFIRSMTSERRDKKRGK